MLAGIQPLKSENTISSHNADTVTCLQANFHKTTIQEMRGSEKQKPEDLMNQIEPCKI
ncbi:MAG: hypothetical protein AB9861_13095 [Methanosarcina sp.]